MAELTCYHPSKFLDELSSLKECVGRLEAAGTHGSTQRMKVAELRRYHTPKSIDAKFDPRAYVDRMMQLNLKEEVAEMLSLSYF